MGVAIFISASSALKFRQETTHNLAFKVEKV